MSKVIVKIDSKVLDNLVRKECVEFGNNLWEYHCYDINGKNERRFQNPESGEILTVEEIYNLQLKEK